MNTGLSWAHFYFLPVIHPFNFTSAAEAVWKGAGQSLISLEPKLDEEPKNETKQNKGPKKRTPSCSSSD